MTYTWGVGEIWMWLIWAEFLMLLVCSTEVI
jgi:hypothetical protein